MPRLQETPAGEPRGVFPVMPRAPRRTPHRVIAPAASVRVEAIREELTLTSRERFEGRTLRAARARTRPRQHVVHCKEHGGASGAAAAVEMEPISIPIDPLAQIDESNECVAARRTMVGHRQADVLDRATNPQPRRKLLFGLGRPDGDLGGAGRRHTTLCVLRDRKHPRRRNLRDLVDLGQFVGLDPGERLSDVREVLVGIPREGTGIEEEVRFLAQVDEVYTSVLRNELGDLCECRLEMLLVQLPAAGGPERHVLEIRTCPEISAANATFGVEVTDLITSRATGHEYRCSRADWILTIPIAHPDLSRESRTRLLAVVAGRPSPEPSHLLLLIRTSDLGPLVGRQDLTRARQR